MTGTAVWGILYGIIRGLYRDLYGIIRQDLTVMIHIVIDQQTHILTTTITTIIQGIEIAIQAITVKDRNMIKVKMVLVMMEMI